MAAIPLDNGGDDKRDEPWLKYQQMGGNVPPLLSNDTASCVAVAAKMIALGTHHGTVHILDFLGNQVKEFQAHTAPVNDLSFDIEGEYIGSCSDDGSVVINSLFTDDEKMKFEYHHPMKAISLDPTYAKKQSKRFVAGSLSGHLYMNSKKGFGYKEVLHSGEGPIYSVKWRGSLIAWANEAGVKVYDTAKDQSVTCIERPRGSPHPMLPHLVWLNDTLLVIGWGTSVQIASVISTAYGKCMYSRNQVDIVASFHTSYFIAGIAPFGDSLAILALSPQGIPELRIVSRNNDELTRDALSVHDFEHYKAKDYSFAHSPFTASSYAGGKWAAGASDEPLYYIVSPKDVVIAKPRDAEDHLDWLFKHDFIDEVLAILETDGEVQTELNNKRDNRSTEDMSYTISIHDEEAASKLLDKSRREAEVMKEYWRQVNESEGFDVEGVQVPQGVNTYGVLKIHYPCRSVSYNHPELVHRYAQLGLHRYNMLQGTNFKLSSIVKFNRTWTNPHASYFFTLDASDGPSHQIFQVQVDEQSYGSLDVVVSKARVKGTTRHPEPPFVYQDEEDVHQGRLPSWPSDFSDSRRFHMLNSTELFANEWIVLYFELAICGDDRTLRESSLPTFTIVDVVIETNSVKSLEERLNARNVILYITYTHSGIDGKAIVRRDLTAEGELSLHGVCRRHEIVVDRFLFYALGSDPDAFAAYNPDPHFDPEGTNRLAVVGDVNGIISGVLGL